MFFSWGFQLVGWLRLLATAGVMLLVVGGCFSSDKPAPPVSSTTATNTTNASPPAEPSPEETVKQPNSSPETTPPTEPVQPEPPSSASLAAIDFGAQDPAEVKAALADLASADVKIRDAADAKLEGIDAPIASQLAGLLLDQDANVRRGAAFFLIDRFEPTDARMIAAFSESLADSDPTVVQISLSVVNRFPHDALLAAIPRLAKILGDGKTTASNRAAVARLLANLEQEGESALPALLAAMKSDGDKSVRSASLMAVSRIALPVTAVPAFIEALKNDPDATVRGLAAVRLGKLGAESSTAAKDLAAALADADEGVRRKSLEALILLGAASVPALTEQLTSRQADIRKQAVFALGKIGPSAAPAAAALKSLANDPDEEVRKLAELALQRIAVQQ